MIGPLALISTPVQYFICVAKRKCRLLWRGRRVHRRRARANSGVSVSTRGSFFLREELCIPRWCGGLGLSEGGRAT